MKEYKLPTMPYEILVDSFRSPGSRSLCCFLYIPSTDSSYSCTVVDVNDGKKKTIDITFMYDTEVNFDETQLEGEMYLVSHEAGRTKLNPFVYILATST